MNLRPPVVLDSDSRTESLMAWVNDSPPKEVTISGSKYWLITSLGLSEEAAQRLLTKS